MAKMFFALSLFNNSIQIFNNLREKTLLEKTKILVIKLFLFLSTFSYIINYSFSFYQQSTCRLQMLLIWTILKFCDCQRPKRSFFHILSFFFGLQIFLLFYLERSDLELCLVSKNYSSLGLFTVSRHIERKK